MSAIFYLDYTKEPPVWGETSNAEFKQIALCMQEILLWRGESPFDINLGIDYSAVFNGESFLTGQLETILDKYRKFFMDINYQLAQDKVNSEIVEITINFLYLSADVKGNNTLASKSAKITANTNLGKVKNVAIK